MSESVITKNLVKEIDVPVRCINEFINIFECFDHGQWKTPIEISKKINCLLNELLEFLNVNWENFYTPKDSGAMIPFRVDKTINGKITSHSKIKEASSYYLKLLLQNRELIQLFNNNSRKADG